MQTTVKRTPSSSIHCGCRPAERSTQNELFRSVELALYALCKEDSRVSVLYRANYRLGQLDRDRDSDLPCVECTTQTHRRLRPRLQTRWAFIASALPRRANCAAIGELPASKTDKDPRTLPAARRNVLRRMCARPIVSACRVWCPFSPGAVWLLQYGSVSLAVCMHFASCSARASAPVQLLPTNPPQCASTHTTRRQVSSSSRPFALPPPPS